MLHLQFQRVDLSDSTRCLFFSISCPCKTPSLIHNRKEKGIDEDDNEDEKIGLRVQEMGIVNETSGLLA